MPDLNTKDEIQRYFNLSNEIVERLECYHDLLLKWQKAINLVSSKSINEAWERHFADSLQILPFIPPTTKIYVDLGCGGGFPGLVLAILRPDIDVHLVESDERKGQFMRTVIREAVAQNAFVHTRRIEDITAELHPDFVTARALAALDDLFGLCLPWAEQNKDIVFCFLKGARAEEEIESAKRNFDFDLETSASITEPSAQILQISNLKKRH